MHIRGLVCIIFLIACQSLSTAQQDSIYRLAEEMPLLKACQDSTDQKDCTSERILRFVYHNLKYPISALEDSLRGQVVVQFVIEKDGSTGPDSLLKDIGGGCGEEALRVIALLRKAGDIWIPAKNKGQVVRTYFTLPIRFAPPKPVKTLPYSINGQDTIYVEIDEGVEFHHPTDTAIGLSKWINQMLKYPEDANKACACGKVTVELLIKPDGTHRIMEVLDYSSLGIDFTYEAIDFIGKTQGMWIPAQYQGRPVGSTIALPLQFISSDPACKEINTRFQNATAIVNQANLLFAEGLLREAIIRWSLALHMIPDNAEWQAARGRAFLELQQYREACYDMTMVQDQLNVTWYAQFLPAICKLGEASGEDTRNDQNQ